MTFYLGVDVSEATLDAACTCGDYEETLKSYPNRPKGWKALAKKATALAAAHGESSVHLILEPTGGYERGLVDYAYRIGWQVTRVNPFYVRRFIQGQGQRGKSDARDALMLTRYGNQQQPPAQDQMDPGARELQALVSRRDDLKKLLRAERNRLKQAQHDPTTPATILDSLERTIKMLEAELNALEVATQELLRSTQELGAQEKLLRTTPGVGRQISLRLLPLFHHFHALTRGEGTASQLVAFLGLDPQPYESGRSLHKRASISRMGDRAGRADLYMGALGGVRGNNPLRTFYERLLQRGKAKKLALVACSRKILIWAWAVFSSNQPFVTEKALAKS